MRRTYVVHSNRSNGWITLLVAAALVVYSRELIAIGFIGIILWLASDYLKFREDRKAIKAVNEAAALMEANHRDMSYNDPYGKYEPATMPLTYPICDTFPYKD